MSSSLVNTVTLVQNPQFRERVKAAMLETALVVASGDAQGPGNPVLRALRTSLALSVLADAEPRVDAFLRLVANDNAISAEALPTNVTDAQIRGVVTGMWEAVAVAVPNLGR